MKREVSFFSARSLLTKLFGVALAAAFLFGTLWVSPVQAETDSGSCITIKVYKFEDKNGNGVKDVNENYLSGWQFTLTKPNNTTEMKSTGSQGYATFTISSCAYGTYTLTETLQNGWYNTTGSLSQQKEISANDKNWTAHFGNAKDSTIKVRKFEDKNGNGNKDSGEGWLNGWSFTLYNSNGDSIGSGSTSGSGSSAGTLTFGNLTSGTYTVTETLQMGYLSTTGLSQSIALGYDKTEEIKFGNAKLAEICVYKFEDLDGDGVKDDGEVFLPGWTFDLYDSQDNLLGSGITNANGKVSFWVFVPYDQTKTFKAVEIPQDSHYATTPTEQTTTPVGYGGWAELFFGNAPYGEILVSKFEDLDGDGMRDWGEPPIPDWGFDLSQSESIIGSSTNLDGELIFGELTSGTYTVTEQMSEDYYPTTPNPQSTSVAPGQQAELTFGNRRYEMDYGDLPDEYGLTLFSEDGARHRPIPLCLASEVPCGEDVWLGEVKDDEYDGAPHSAAFGDDPTNNDEDGVVRGLSWGGGMGVITVTVSGGSACLMGWVDYFDEANNDFGIDHQFSESFTYNSSTYTEKVINNLYLGPGTHPITFDLPPDFANTSVFARFRLSPLDPDSTIDEETGQCNQPAADLTGLVIGGEVEDYYWQFGPTAVEMKKLGAAPQQSSAGFGLVAVGLAVSLTALWVGRRRKK